MRLLREGSAEGMDSRVYYQSFAILQSLELLPRVRKNWEWHKNRKEVLLMCVIVRW